MLYLTSIVTTSASSTGYVHILHKKCAKWHCKTRIFDEKNVSKILEFNWLWIVTNCYNFSYFFSKKSWLPSLNVLLLLLFLTQMIDKQSPIMTQTILAPLQTVRNPSGSTIFRNTRINVTKGITLMIKAIILIVCNFFP